MKSFHYTQGGRAANLFGWSKMAEAVFYLNLPTTSRCFYLVNL